MRQGQRETYFAGLLSAVHGEYVRVTETGPQPFELVE
jgi:hypothetical protein